MKQDIRKTDEFRLSLEFFSSIHAPQKDAITDGDELCLSPDGTQAAFKGIVFDDLEHAPRTHVVLADVENGELTRLPNVDSRLPKWSPDGSSLAFLWDPTGKGHDQVFVADKKGENPEQASSLSGIVENFHWSPDGSKILVCLAGHGATLAAAQGGSATGSVNANTLPDWLPKVDSGDAENLWRSIHIVDCETKDVRDITPANLNPWEASWFGPNKVAIIASSSYFEDAWYAACVFAIDLVSGNVSEVHQPQDQIGVVAASPSGERIAFIEAVCSDRLLVCGHLMVYDAMRQQVFKIDTNDIDLTHATWCDDNSLAIAGVRADQTIVAKYGFNEQELYEVWVSNELSCGVIYPFVASNRKGELIVIAEAYQTVPHILDISKENSPKLIFRLSYDDSNEVPYSGSSIEPFTWVGRDGLDLEGWLVTPQGEGPFPVVMDIHGGPVWSVRTRWKGRLRYAAILAEQGYAIFYPNIRGSSGRGQDFARLIKGDMGGEDTHDLLTGVDALVDRGIAIPEKIGVTGTSYGGFAACWLITQDDRFAAAVPVSCISNWLSQHNTSFVPYFDEEFLQDDPFSSESVHFARSPVVHAKKANTPTLQIAGALDEGTLPTQSLEFHRALLEGGAESVLVTYPNGGHGIRNYPDVIDHTARMIQWFNTHMPPQK